MNRVGESGTKETELDANQSPTGLSLNARCVAPWPSWSILSGLRFLTWSMDRPRILTVWILDIIGRATATWRRFVGNKALGDSTDHLLDT